MLPIAFSWIILFYFFLTYGIAARYLLKINVNAILTLLLGMVFQTILLTSIAFFVRIGIEVFAANLILAIILGVIFRKRLSESLTEIKSWFLSFSTTSKIIFLVISVSALLKCAQSPFILDNESYYVQTIKWLNEYGFVKGLANLNIAFGQTSGWHILQSGFNFSFFTDRINDINGFLLILCSFFFLFVFEKEWHEKRQFHWIGFVLFFNVLSFQFINSPSPDIPLFLIMQIILYYYLNTEKTLSEQKTIIVLFILLVFIKITILPLGILLLSIFIKERKTVLFSLAIGSIFGLLWVSKNIILIGYPLYPFGNFALNVDWKIPENLFHFINNMIRNHEFLDAENYKSLSVMQKFEIWIRFGGINGIFNKGILLLFAIAPFTKIIRSNIEYKIVYFTLLLHFIIVFVTSPQFRFFLAEFIFLSVVVCSELSNRFIKKTSLVFSALIISALLPIAILFVSDFKNLTQNELNQQPESLKWSQLWLPEKNSKYSHVKFEKITLGNLQYYSPNPNFFFYGTADGPLPCTNADFVNHLYNNYSFIPQLRDGNLSNGFYSAPSKQKTP